LNQLTLGKDGPSRLCYRLRELVIPTPVAVPITIPVSVSFSI